MKYLSIILIFFSSFLQAQDSLIVTYLQIGVGDNKVLLPIETAVIHDTLKYSESEFRYDTLKKVSFTYVDGFNQVCYNTGYLIEESYLWVTSLSAYAQPELSSSQYFILCNGRRYLFKDYLVDQDEYTKVHLNSKPRKKKWYQKPEYFVLDMYER